MTFLNPLILLGLAAAAIPVILHLINLRKLRTIEFSSLAFLKEMQRTRIRRLKIRQLLLLVLRTLLILLIVLAFARPTMTGTLAGAIGTKARMTAVILIDDSFSMTAADEHGEYFKQAREAAISILELLDREDEVFLLPFSSATLQHDEPIISGVTASKARLEAMTISAVRRPLEDCLRTAAALIAESNHLLKEVYVISDFQQGLVIAPELPPERLFPDGTRLFLLQVGTKNVRNLGIRSLAIPNSILEANKPFSLDVVVTNHSPDRAENVMVSVFLDGTRVAQQGVSVESGGTARASFLMVARTAGFHKIMVELEGDDLEFDNRRHLAFHLPERVRVLLVGTPLDARYVRLALETRQESGSALELMLVSPERLTAEVLAQADVVIILSSSGLSTLQAGRLNSYIHEGGGLLLFPEFRPSMDPEQTNAVLKALRLPTIRSVESPVDSRQDTFAGFEHAEISHPLFEGMFSENDPGRTSKDRTLESPHISRFVRFSATERSASIITMTDGSPFLLEQESGNGRALLFAVAPRPDWSDFPLKGLFVPLLHRSIAYLSQEHIRQPSVFAGQPVLLPFHEISREPLTIVTPGDLHGDFKLAPGIGTAFTETRQFGIYEARNTSGIIRMFSVNPDPLESITSKADDKALEVLAERIGITSQSIRRVGGGESVRNVVLETRHGVELWSHMLLAALLVAITETIVARTGKQEAGVSEGVRA